jgi:putative ABC transport system permease protein
MYQTKNGGTECASLLQELRFMLRTLQARTRALGGVAIGLVAAYYAGRVVSSQLYEVSASDPMILGGATALVFGIALLATVIPAYRSSRLDPSRVLRLE